MSHPHQHSLPDGVSDVPEWWQPASSLPELPEGTTCGAEDQNAELRKLLIHTQQQLKESQDLLRRTDRDARSAAGLKKQVAACEEKLREAVSGQAHQAQELTQKLHQAEQSLRTAHARLKDRDRSSVLLEESAAAAQTRAGSLAEALAKETAARAESAAAAEAAEKKLGKAQAGWEQERAALAAEAARVAKEGARRVEELEGSLAECRGRVVGLGEGCGRCWQMLDEAQGEGHTAKMQAAGIAAGVCGFVAVAAYVYTLMQKRQISHLKLESEKLRCAVLEAQGGVRQRMSRAGSAARIGQQIPTR